VNLTKVFRQECQQIAIEALQSGFLPKSIRQLEETYEKKFDLDGSKFFGNNAEDKEEIEPDEDSILRFKDILEDE
jgi:hypothetical protein